MYLHQFRRPFRRWAAAAAAALLAAASASAFESKEHREMGEMAIAVARAYAASPDGAAGLPPPALQALKDIADDYGFLIECVDFFLYPEKMLAYRWKLKAAQSGPPGGLPDGSEGGKVSPELRKECDKEDGAAFIQASHGNHAHFQQDLMISLRLWHFMAVALARQEGNYYGALFINAIADHYLHDFFAPGHLVTPRDRLTDLPSTATHDLANQMGALFRPTLTPKIERVLRFMCPATAGDAGCTIRADLKPLLENEARSLRIDKLSEEVPKLLPGPSQRRRLLLRGDGFLGEVDQARQRVFMLAVQVASILDVLQGDNSFTRVDYRYDQEEGEPKAVVDFGKYDFEHDGKAYAGLIDEPMPPASVAAAEAARARSSDFQSWNFTPCSLGGCDDRLYRLRTRAPIVSISNQRESQSSGAFSARNVYNVEVSTVGWLVDVSRFSGRRLSGIEVAPVLGYSVYKQGHFHGNGPTLRLAAAIPETEFSFGPYLRYFDYPVKGDKVRKLSYGLRIDSGFSSYFTFYVSGGVDRGTSVDGALERGRVWAGGLRLGIPLTRLKLGL